MRHTTHAGRIDANQPDIVKALRAVGASVWITARMGDGAPDLVVGYRKVNYSFEIKDPSQPPSKRLLTADELRWHAAWNGHVLTILTAEEALRAIGATK